MDLFWYWDSGIELAIRVFHVALSFSPNLDINNPFEDAHERCAQLCDVVSRQQVLIFSEYLSHGSR